MLAATTPGASGLTGDRSFDVEVRGGTPPAKVLDDSATDDTDELGMASLGPNRCIDSETIFFSSACIYSIVCETRYHKIYERC